MSQTNRFQDRYGLTLTARSVTAVESYIKGIDQFLSGDVGADTSLAQAIEADGGFAAAYASLALIQQFQGTAAEAKQSAAQARACMNGLSKRERQYVEAIAMFVDGGASRVLPLVHEHLDEFPGDAVLLFLHGFLNARSGRPDWQREQFCYLTHLAPHYGDDWFFLGQYAFAHHAISRFEESRRLAEQSLAGNPRCGHAVHSLAHVFYETNAHAAGATFLDEWMANYDRRAPMHCHLTWHWALCELSVGHYARVMELYEGAIRPEVARTRTSMYDAASLLWRYQIYGCARDALPWSAVGELAGRMTTQPGMAFADANAALALAAARDEVAFGRLIDGLRALDAQGHPTAGCVVLPLVQGIWAFAQGAYDEAIQWIEPIADQTVRIGGSNAQREVFEDTLLQAYLRASRYAQAEALLRTRLGRRPSARDFFWLGRAQVGSGQMANARISLKEAQHRWADADSEAAELMVLERTCRLAQAIGSSLVKP
jgi:tetratricopeptide (TPR) repeat protein